MKEWLAKWSKNKKMEWLVALVLVLVVLLALWPPQTGSTQQTAADELTARMEAVLSRIQGAGLVEVVISYAASEGNFSAASAKVPVGAVIVAQGAGDIRVQMELERAARTLLDVKAGAVQVFRMGEA